ncbi:CalY family protein [Pseudalkalibacillus decolorationis]|uniref:CalY family protein n=1 Tax=Pseudalkalibacillus decolorationis TaxID=163879 RepID=UPI002147F670|nr:CalY family protein [Pseudalkalibacillus decolorationis]
MSIKKKLGMGVASAALGLALVGGGTYAYFSDTATSTNTFAAGTLDLSVDPQEIINVDNIKPGDTMLRSFELVNGGSLDIKNVVVNTDYSVTDAAGDNVGDFGEHIRVNFMFNVDKLDVPVWSTTLADLKAMSSEAVKAQFEHMFGDEWGSEGLVAGSSDLLYVQFEFVDNGADQNEFQGDSLQLVWDFVGSQTAGEEK